MKVKSTEKGGDLGDGVGLGSSEEGALRDALGVGLDLALRLLHKGALGLTRPTQHNRLGFALESRD